MADKTLSGSIALTKLVHVKMEKKGKSGMVKGLFIPIDVNYLETDDKGAVYLPVRVRVTDEQDEYKQNGFIAKSIGSTVYKNASEEQKQMFKDKQNEITPILGSVKDWSNSGGGETSGAASEETFSEDDDLPF